MGSGDPIEMADGLSLAPFRALRPRADGDALATLLCPPYDVIDASMRANMLNTNPDNAVGVILPDPTPAGYAAAAARLVEQIERGVLAVEDQPALYVYEMAGPDGQATRGLLGAVQLRDAEDGVILPHENTMAGPVADRLAVMSATDADLEPIYLLYDGGGAASDLLHDVDGEAPIARTTTPDGLTHRLWAITAADRLASVAHDLRGRKALIADGHHRYATYQERQRRGRATDVAGPWDRGLALLVDSSRYGPQVHAIHRVIPDLELAHAVEVVRDRAHAEWVERTPQDALELAAGRDGFQLVLTDGVRSVVLSDPDGTLAQMAAKVDEPAALAQLDVSIVHRGLVEQIWQIPDDVDHVLYAHSVSAAVAEAVNRHGIALLLQPTPVGAVAAVAAGGARMPRKSTLFTPKPASGLVMRRLADQV